MITVMNNFWLGKISLWKSYWLVGELLNALVLLLILKIEIYFFKNNDFIVLLPFLNFNDFTIVSKILILSWSIYITVGIWRSAENYGGNFIWIFLTLLVLSYRIFTLKLMIF